MNYRQSFQIYIREILFLNRQLYLKDIFALYRGNPAPRHIGKYFRGGRFLPCKGIKAELPFLRFRAAAAARGRAKGVPLQGCNRKSPRRVFRFYLLFQVFFVSS